MSKAKNLKNFPNDNISITRDLPPVLRPLKKELLNQRRVMPPEEKTRASVRFLKQWPYLQLKSGSNVIHHDADKSAIVKNILGMDPKFHVTESTD